MGELRLELQFDQESGKLYYTCPSCKNKDCTLKELFEQHRHKQRLQVLSPSAFIRSLGGRYDRAELESPYRYQCGCGLKYEGESIAFSVPEETRRNWEKWCTENGIFQSL